MGKDVPKKIQELMDLHGPGIPHLSFDGRYTIEVYPHVYPREDGGESISKDVTVIDGKTGGRWVRRLNEREFSPPPRKGLLGRLFG